jgi:aspartate oxidase
MTRPSDLASNLDRYLGVERDQAGLSALVKQLGSRPATPMIVPALAARAALLREESRGAHYRTDYSATLPGWQGRILWKRDIAPRFEWIQ